MKKMTKVKAKKIALDKLRFYQTVPEHHRTFVFLPDWLKYELLVLHNYCSMCELFCENPRVGKRCGECPLICPTCNSVTDESLKENIRVLQNWMPEI